MTVGRSNKDIARRAAVLELSKSGYKPLQIAQKLGTSRQRVYVLLNEAERADYLAETKKPVNIVREWLSGPPDGSWTVKEMLRDLYFIGNGKEGSQVETIKRCLRKLGYVPRWVHASYVGAPLPKPDDENEIDLDEILEAANANAEKIAKGRGQYDLGHLAVAVISSPKPSDKIPKAEQVLSAGALCMNLVNAASAAGWGAPWLTGWPAHDTEFAVRAFSCLPGETVAGIIHIGARGNPAPDRPRPDLARVVRWGI